MRRTLIALFFVILLPLLAAHAQPPAPVGGDMSNTTTTATGSSTPRKLADRAADTFNPKDFGAIGDGQSHLLTAGAPLLASCPQLTAPVETDACAVQAAINTIAAGPKLMTYGSPSGTIKVPANTVLKMGTQSLTANLMGLTWAGEDQWSSALLVGANPMLNFGLNNQIGIGGATVASTGSGFLPGDTLTLTGLGGTCEDPPVITVLTTGTNGEVLTQSISHAGSCSVTPSNPLDYLTNGVGYGATYNGTFTGSPGVLTGALLLQTTGTGCVNGEVLTAVGGTTPAPGTTRPFKLTVTNAVGGLIQRGGVTILDPGSYGLPPANPVATTGSAACVGGAFNIAQLTNNGGMLDMHNLYMQADGQGGSIVKAQFNMPQRSLLLRDIVLRAFGSNYFGGGFDLNSLTNSMVQNVDGFNNTAYINSNPSAALFTVRHQNNLFGHFEQHWDNVGSAAWTGGGIHYISTAQDTVPFQGLFFHRLICGLALHCLVMENPTSGGGRSYGNVVITELYASQSVQQIEITLGLGIIIANSNFGVGTTRITPLPSSVDEVVLNNVNQWQIHNSYCSSGLPVIPNVTCFHLMGRSSFGMATGNIITNAARVPNVTAYVFDSGTGLNTQTGDFIIPGGLTPIVPVVDNGTKNTTQLNPNPSTPCPPTGQLVSGSTYQVPDNTNCIFLSGTTIPALTIQLPVNPTAYQEIKFTSFSTITALTVQVYNGNGQVLGGGMPTTITSGAPFTVKSMSTGTATRWQRM